jgi:hypothetical protein
MQWYTYWSVWGFFFFLDLIMPNILKKLPLFYFSKLLFLVWLFLPATQGGLFLYKKFFSRINSPFDINRIYQFTDNFKIKINKLIDYALMTEKDEIHPRKKRDHPREEKKEHVKTPEEIVREVLKSPERRIHTETSMDSCNTQATHNLGKETEHKKPRFDQDEYDSRQNIVHNAKIDTDKLKANLQNVRDQFTNSVDRLREVRGNIISGNENKAASQSSSNSSPSVGLETQTPVQTTQETSSTSDKITPNAPTLNVPSDKEIYQTTFSKTNDKEHPREVLKPQEKKAL